ncbi:MAG: hypothetical protein Q7T55_17955 [Solirubrobacteraceae bacterium]|nr:hypothetical protein [Solirubrobacteraceae bacterium]
MERGAGVLGGGAERCQNLPGDDGDAPLDASRAPSSGAPRAFCKVGASFLQGPAARVRIVLTLEPIVLSATAGPGLAGVKGRAEVTAVIRAAIDERAAKHHLGSALGDVTRTADGLGWFRTYPAGWVVYRADRGAHALYGAIGARWLEFGGTESFLGWPATDHLHSALTIDRLPGHHTRFDGGLVIWSASTGAFALHGEILELWRQLGAESGALGLPLSDEHDLVQRGRAVGRRSVFQHGEISWSRAGGAAVTALSHPFEVGSGTASARIAGIGGGGDEPPMPAIRRFVRGNVSLAVAGDERERAAAGHRPGDGGDLRARSSAAEGPGPVDRDGTEQVVVAVDSFDAASVTTVVGAPGAFAVEVSLRAIALPDGSVSASGTVALREGAAGEATAEREVAFVIPTGDAVNLSVRIADGDPSGDHAEILISLWNHPV